MSTKIYNGYRMPKMSLGALQNFCVPIAEKTQALADALYQKTLADRVVSIIDQVTVNGGIIYRRSTKGLKETSPISAAWFEIREEQQEAKKNGTRSMVDFGSEVCFIPSGDFIYAILYGDGKIGEPWRDTVKDFYYPYWDNTDPQDGVSYEDWQARGKEWDEALGERSTPGRVGFAFTMSDNDWIPWYESSKLLGDIPSFETRLKRTAENILLSRKLDVLSKLTPDAKPSSWTLIMDLLRSVRENGEVDAEILRLRTVLKDVLDKDDLYKEYPVKEL